MKNYLSMGFGWNSVAYYIMLQNMGWTAGKPDGDKCFEAVFVNHGSDWPETYEYADYFIATGRPVTILTPQVNTVEKVVYEKLIDYCEAKTITPSRKSKMCTDRFKIKTVNNYKKAPCFMHIGYAAGEESRMAMNGEEGTENRYMLIEEGVDRNGCREIIESAGLDVPMKSGCYFCPYQGTWQYKELRRKHPDLFCRAQRLEDQQNKRVKKNGEKWQKYYLCSVPLKYIDKQMFLPTIEDLEYPPCQCGL